MDRLEVVGRHEDLAHLEVVLKESPLSLTLNMLELWDLPQYNNVLLP